MGKIMKRMKRMESKFPEITFLYEQETIDD